MKKKVEHRRFAQAPKEGGLTLASARPRLMRGREKDTPPIGELRLPPDLPRAGQQFQVQRAGLRRAG